MMTTIGEIYEAVDRFAPFSTAEGYDNVGVLIGDDYLTVSRCMVALDVTKEVCLEALEQDVDLILSHHPIIFHPLKRISSSDVVYRLIQGGISVISAHTNLDRAAGGVNDQLAEKLGLTDCRVVEGGEGFALIGTVSDTVFLNGIELTEEVKRRLRVSALRVFDAKKPIHTIGFCCGSGGDFLRAACAAGADAYITGDVKHDQVVDALGLGITLIDAGHFETERFFVEPLLDYLAPLFPEVEFLIADSCRPLFRTV